MKSKLWQPFFNEYAKWMIRIRDRIEKEFKSNFKYRPTNVNNILYERHSKGLFSDILLSQVKGKIRRKMEYFFNSLQSSKSPRFFFEKCHKEAAFVWCRENALCKFWKPYKIVREIAIKVHALVFTRPDKFSKNYHSFFHPLSAYLANENLKFSKFKKTWILLGVQINGQGHAILKIWLKNPIFFFQSTVYHGSEKMK